MMAEQVESSRDDRILKGFTFDDIDLESLQAYKNMFASAKPQHTWLELELFELFKMIGGWRRERQSGEEGITLAGVLMFGTWDAIQDAAPNYFVDYREREEAKSESRWIDRVYPDGSWSGNVFDFYRRTYRKLVNDLKVPFELKDGIRKDDTKAHEAIREALVNTLVHADYSGRSSIFIVKRPDLFGFRNPGLMRVPPEVAIKGGESDCRNRRMHHMFLLIGAGERAGSGVPKIYSGWANRRIPKLYEKRIPSDQTLLELSTTSLIPQETLDLLVAIFGERFSKLDEFEKMILVTAAIEGWINHHRACQLTSMHSREVTLTLPRLVDKGYLVADGEGRDKSYSIKGLEPPSPEDVFPNALSSANDSTYMSDNLTHSDQSLTHSDGHLMNNDSQRDQFGRLVSIHLNKPFIDELDELENGFRKSLEKMGLDARIQKRLSPDKMKMLIRNICKNHFIAISVLEQILERKSQSIRQNYLKAMVEKGELVMAFPHKPNTPRQGYSLNEENTGGTDK